MSVSPVRDRSRQVTHFVGIQNDDSAERNAKINIQARNGVMELVAGGALLETALVSMVESVKKIDPDVNACLSEPIMSNIGKLLATSTFYCEKAELPAEGPPRTTPILCRFHFHCDREIGHRAGADFD